jgi:4-amino-4-deoxy-L-arabinose transferase-like glycosyltransferase
VGAAFRIGLYVADRSLWADEARLALSILHRTPRELLKPLEFEQVSPPGFLLLVKGAQQVFGNSELALRLAPLLAGLASLVLFVALARHCLKPAAALLACLLFAIAEPLVLYSTEVKPYSGDVAIALALCWLALAIGRPPLRLVNGAVLGVAGAVAVLFSFPAAFVLGGIGLAFLVGAAPGMRIRALPGLAVAAAIWAVGLWATLSLSPLSAGENTRLLQYFTESLPGFPPAGILAGARWLAGRIPRFFEFPGGLDHGLSILCAVAGTVALARREPRLSIVWAGTAALALLAACLRLYPFEGRLILFLVPAVYLVVGEGVVQICSLLHYAPAGGTLVSGALVLLLLAHPVAGSFDGLKRPRNVEQLLPVLGHVSAARRPGDAVHVYYAAQYAARYYLETRSLNLADLPVSQVLAPTAQAVGSGWYAPALVSRPPSFFVGTESRESWLDYGRQLEVLSGSPRVWIIFSHVNAFLGIDEQRFFLQHLDASGTRLEAFEQPGASAYLYDLRPHQGANGSGLPR